MRLLSSTCSSSISVLMCSKTGFREESVTCFSEARMSVKSWRGRRSWLTSSKTLMSLSLGMRCQADLSPASTPQMACCCSKNLKIISNVDPHLVTTSFISECSGMSNSACFFFKLTFPFPASRKSLHQMPACSGSGFHSWYLEDFGNGQI